MNPPTQQAALQARIEALEAELRRTRAEFATFSNRLSHDMQAILRNIQGFGEALREQAAAKLSPREARHLERMLAGAQRGDGLMRDLAMLCGAAIAELQPQGVDVRALLDECILELAPVLARRQVQWSLAPAPWPRIDADPALLRLALGQLVGNAVKFTRPRETAHIAIALAATPGEWVLTVADDGVGFDAAYGERLFQPFERLHLPTEFEGNGIGLALVKAVADRHGARVHAEALPQAGARFTLALPRQLPPAALAACAPDCTPVASGAPQKVRILLVDDEPLVLATVRLVLEREGHEVVTAASGEAALQALRQQAEQARGFDVVISDWLMPGVGGAEVVLSAKAFQPTVRTIVLTGQRPDPAGAGLPPAVDQVLAKPVSAADLRRAVAMSR
jgi:CheY-like chemotaxis protein/two-component sensor histidine kinase